MVIKFGKSVLIVIKFGKSVPMVIKFENQFL